MVYSKEELEKAWQAGEKMKYLFFWGHQKSKNGQVTSSCFSQWWLANFIVDGITYPTAEHWMMAGKAKLFNDQEALERIIEASSPAKVKQIGREVKGFSQEKWEQERMKLVIDGNYHKFSQHNDLKTFLLNTKKRIIVEASPVDKIWGIGLDASSEFATIPTKWRGLNLLGFALMQVRERINNEKQ